jgi:hypothetical protein
VVIGGSPEVVAIGRSRRWSPEGGRGGVRAGGEEGKR